MKHLLRSLPLLLLTAITLFSVSCSKDSGEPGADGAQGPPGAKGDKGDKGDPGTVGTANVIYSNWLDVVYEPDTVHLAGGKIDTIGWYTSIDVPKLSKTLLATGDVKVYINLNEATDPVITPLPYSDENGIVIRFVAYEKVIQFYSNIEGAGTFLDGGKKYQQYRYVLIPGGTTARTATGSVDWNNYKSVQAFLGLKD